MQLILYISHHLSLRSFFTNHSPLRPLTIFIDNSRSIFFFFSNQARSYTLIVERRSDVTAHAIRNPHAEYIERNKNATIYITHCCLHPLEPLQTTASTSRRILFRKRQGRKIAGREFGKKWQLSGGDCRAQGVDCRRAIAEWTCPFRLTREAFRRPTS